MKVKFFDPGKGYLKIKKEIDSEIQRVLTAGDLILREDVEIFEENLARYVGTRYAVALNSGTDAIYLALKALNITGNVALPSHTFKSTCGAVINAGATPAIYDMNGSIKDEIVIKDKFINFHAHIPVHIAGELSPIPDLGIPIIEDACQAFGAIKNPITSAQCWSFYPAKILGGFGDGGAITTNDKKIYEYVREARNHFKSDNRDFGINSRMDNLQAAILNVKFKYLPQYIARRKEIAEMYLQGLRGCGLPNNQLGRSWQDFIIRTPSRDALYDALKAQGAETIKNEYPWTPEYPKLPLAAKYEAETLRLPCNPDLTNDEIDYVIEKVNEFYG